MSTSPAGSITVSIPESAGLDDEQRDRLARRLMVELREAGFGVHAVQEPAPSGAKGIDAASIGQLAVSLVPALLPQFLELVLRWKRHSSNAGFVLQCGSARVEVGTTGLTADEVARLAGVLGQSVAASAQASSQANG